MRVFVVTPPQPAVSWEEVRPILSLGADDGRQMIVMALVAAAIGHIDGPTGWLGRAIGVQTLEARVDHWDAGTIRLRCAPIIAITSVKYLDQAGVEQAVDPSGYGLFGDTLEPAFGTAWPPVRWQREAVRIRYTAGYPAVPAPIKTAIILMVRQMFEGGSEPEISPLAETLLQPFRIYA